MALINYALALNGSTAASSSQLSADYPVARVIDDTLNHPSPLFFHSAAGQIQTVTIDFNASRRLTELDLTFHSDSASTVPNYTETTPYTARDYVLEYWNGTTWVNLATTVNNDKRRVRHVLSAAVTTTKIRLVTSYISYNYLIMWEFQAWGDVPPAVPTNVTANAVSPTVIRIAWNASMGTPAAAGYKIKRDNSVVIDAGNLTSYDVGSLAPSTTYSIQVAAYNSAGTLSAYSDAVSVSTPVDPNAPVIVSTSPLPYAQTGQPYSVQLQKTGAAGTWTATVGNLPAGAMSASGLITIPVTGASNYTFTARFTRAAGGAFVEKSFTIPASAYASIELMHRRPLKIDYLQKIRYFEPISGADETIEDAVPKREFTLTVLYHTTVKQSELRQFLYEHRRRQPFLWLNPDWRCEPLLVKMVGPYTENEMLAYGEIEIVLREI